MSRNLIIAIILIAVILIVGVGSYFLFFGGGSGQNNTSVDTFGDLFSSDSVGSSENVGLNEPGSGSGSGDNNFNNQPGESGDFGGVVTDLRKITAKEVSGYGLFGNGDTTTVIRYVDTESGNVFEIDLKSSNTKRVTNTTILQTIDSVWPDKNNVVLRYIDENKDIQTFSAEIISLDDESGESLGELNGSFLDKNIEEIDQRFFKTLLDNIDSSKVAIVISADHSTPCINKGHSDDPVPVLVSGDFIKSDGTTRITEEQAKEGSLGLLQGADVVPTALNLIKSQI